MKRILIVALSCVAGIGIFLVVRSGTQDGSGTLEQKSPPGDKLSALNSEIEKSLRNANPTQDELLREVELLSEAAFFANELVPPDNEQSGKISAADSLAASKGESKDRGYDLPALEKRFIETLQNIDSHERLSSLGEIASYLAGKDSETAKRFLQAILSTQDQETSSDARIFATYFVDALSKHDPAAAAQWTEILPEHLKYPAHQLLARNWVQEDPAALEAWSQTLGDPGLRANVIQMMSHMLSVSDTRGFAADWAKRLAQNEQDGSRLSEIVAQHWAKADFEGAVKWTTNLNNADDKESGILALTKARAEIDAVVAAAWARDALDGKLRGIAIQEAVRNWVKKDPAAAAKWIDGLGDPLITEITFDTIGVAWIKKDEKAAEIWIENAAVSRQRKDYLYTTSRS